MVLAMILGERHREIKTCATVLGYEIRLIDEDRRIDEEWEKIQGEKPFK